MKKTSLILAVLAAFAVCACSTTKTVTLEDGTVVTETKKERKERQQRVDSFAHEKAAQAIVQRYFVITATQVRVGRMGYPVNGLNEDTNYLLMQGDGGIVQVAFNGPSPGLNGLGGITLPGEIKNFEISKGKKGDLYVTYSMVSSYMNADVNITLHRGGDKATATIMPAFGHDRIEIIGRLIPYRDKNIKIEK